MAQQRAKGPRSRPSPASRRRRRVLPLVLVLVALVAILAVVLASVGGQPRRAPLVKQSPPRPQAGEAPAPPKAPPTARPTAPLARMLGQMIVARFAGTSPSPQLLARARSGQVGGVILFADNFAAGISKAEATISQLQHAAARGGNPPLLVMTDQEGGEVSRVPGPPTLAASEMASRHVAFAQGKETGQLLRSIGVNVDLAPVADVKRLPGSFLGSRSFGATPSEVASRACGFASGLASQRVVYTLKHFPGLGRAIESTDTASVSITSPANELRSDYAAYTACGHGPLAMVMISSAIYPNLIGPLPAVMSPLTYMRELPTATAGPHVVTISDDLQSAAITTQAAPAAHAIDAGLDLLLYAGTEQASADAYGRLLDEARARGVSGSKIRAAYDAIVALKQRAHL